MSSSLMLRRLVVGAFVVATFVWIGSVIAAEMTPAPLNPAAINIQLPKDIKWKESESGSATYVVAGDPNKPGAFYAVLTKWHAGHSSRPHFHQNDRFVQVLSGTWWVGTGAKYDPDHTTPVPTGSFVTHYGKQIHYDGAKEGDTVLLIMGQGPAASTPAEVK
jgi:hypothetical protein